MIGVYDSGVGGLSVLAAIRCLLPTADLVYLADQANVPYGERPIAEVRDLAAAAVATMVDFGAAAVVVACNTASAAALAHVREINPGLVIVGMEPAVKPAAASTRTGRVGVLATATTFQAAVFEDLVGRYAAGVEVIAHPCPGWASGVEATWPDAASAAIIATHLAPLRAAGVDTVVIACTHYAFLRDQIQEAIGPDAVVVEPSEAVARQVVRVAAETGAGTTTYLTTGDPDRLRDQIARLLGESAVVSRI